MNRDSQNNMDGHSRDGSAGCGALIEVPPPEYPLQEEVEKDPVGNAEQGGDGPHLTELRTSHTPDLVSLAPSLDEDLGPSPIEGEPQAQEQQRPTRWGGRRRTWRFVSGAAALAMLTITIWLVVDQQEARTAEQTLARRLDELTQVDLAILHDLSLLERRVDVLGGGWRRRKRDAWEEEPEGWAMPWAWSKNRDPDPPAPTTLSAVLRQGSTSPPPTPPSTRKQTPASPASPTPSKKGVPSTRRSQTPGTTTPTPTMRPRPTPRLRTPPTHTTERKTTPTATSATTSPVEAWVEPTRQTKIYESTPMTTRPANTSLRSTTGTRVFPEWTTRTSTKAATRPVTTSTEQIPRTRVSPWWTDADLAHAWGEYGTEETLPQAPDVSATTEPPEDTSPTSLAMTVDPSEHPALDLPSITETRDWGRDAGIPLAVGTLVLLVAWGGWRLKKGSWVGRTAPTEMIATDVIEMEPIIRRVVRSEPQPSALLPEASLEELQTLEAKSVEETKP